MSDQNLDPHKFSNPNHSLYKPPEDQENSSRRDRR
jgi:hypothetical protein